MTMLDGAVFRMIARPHLRSAGLLLAAVLVAASCGSEPLLEDREGVRIYTVFVGDQEYNPSAGPKLQPSALGQVLVEGVPHPDHPVYQVHAIEGFSTLEVLAMEVPPSAYEAGEPAYYAPAWHVSVPPERIYELLAELDACCVILEPRDDTLFIGKDEYVVGTAFPLDPAYLGEILLEDAPSREDWGEVRAIQGFSPSEVVALLHTETPPEHPLFAPPFYAPAFHVGIAVPFGQRDRLTEVSGAVIECCLIEDPPTIYDRYPIDEEDE